MATDHNRLQHLISRLLDEAINEEEMQELDGILKEDAAARRVYRRYVDLHFVLEESLTPAAQDALEPLAFPGGTSSLQRRLRIFQAAAAILACTCLLLAGRTFLAPTAPETGAASSASRTEIGRQPVALVRVLTEVQWADSDLTHAVGDVLKEGIVRIARGRVTLEFLSGATVTLEGPAEMELHSPMQAYLVHGRMAAKVPEEATGFTVESPGAAVVDLGTEFALNVSEQGVSTVRVYDGEVEASLLGPDGAPLRTARLFTQDGVTVDSKTAGMTPLETTAEQFIRVPELQATGLHIPTQYVEHTLAMEPRIYLRFDGDSDNPARNLAGATHHGILDGEAGLRTDGANTVLSLGEADETGCVRFPDLLEGLNGGEYTIEMWVCPEKIRQMALLSLVRPEPILSKREGPAHQHLTYLELSSNRSSLKHSPATVRFLHRWPAAMGYGTNVFSKASYVPGQWLHVVAVKGQNSLSLYLDGELSHSVALEPNTDGDAYRLFLGQLDPVRPERQFVGLMDELAVYPRALTPQEISTRYQMVQE